MGIKRKGERGGKKKKKTCIEGKRFTLHEYILFFRPFGFFYFSFIFRCIFLRPSIFFFRPRFSPLRQRQSCYNVNEPVCQIYPVFFSPENPISCLVFPILSSPFFLFFFSLMPCKYQSISLST